MHASLSFNTVYADLNCPFCGAPVESGVGFNVGKIEKRRFAVGDEIDWGGLDTRPAVRPENGDLQTIGYFNCDNLKCSSWKDCYPEVQTALIVITNDHLAAVSIYNGPLSGEKFEILEESGTNKE